MQWLASRGVLGTDSSFHLQMGQVPSESGRGGKHKVNLFFHRIVKKEPFNCVVTRLNAGLFHGDFCFLVTLQHIQFIQYEI